MACPVALSVTQFRQKHLWIPAADRHLDSAEDVGRLSLERAKRVPGITRHRPLLPSVQPSERRHTFLILKVVQKRTNTDNRPSLVFSAEGGVDFEGVMFRVYNNFALI